MSAETKVVFDQLTEDAMKLMEDDVYDEKQEVFQRGSSGHCGARMFQTTSHLKIASNLKKQFGRDPSRSELFLYTHTKNHDGTSFIVEKAKKIHDDFMERRDELEAIGEEIDEDQLFYDVVGGHDRKRRLYGFDLYGKVIPSSKGCSETCYSSDNNVEKESVETKAEIEKLKELVETQREQSDAKCGKLGTTTCTGNDCY